MAIEQQPKIPKTSPKGIKPDAPPRSIPFEMRDRGKGSVRGLLLRVQPTGTRTYYVEVTRGVRERIGSSPAYTLTRARTDAAKVLGKAADGADYGNKRAKKRALDASTLGRFIDGEFKTYAEEHIASHADMIARVKRSFADLLDKPMSSITELDLARWNKARTGVALETRKRELTYLKAVLNRAAKTKAIASHQIAGFAVSGTLADGEGHAKVRYLTETEEKRLRDQLNVREARIRAERVSANAWRRDRGYDPYPEIGSDEFADHIKPLVLLALNTGLRRGDLFGLEWAHIDLGRRQIRKVISKSSHARRKAGKRLEAATLPLSAEAYAILNQLSLQRAPGISLVFPSPVTDGKLDNIKKAFAEVLGDANIEGFTFHDLRHTFASRLVMAGVDINTVRELMTHADIKMTLRYAHLSPDHKAAALDKAFAPPAKQQVA